MRKFEGYICEACGNMFHKKEDAVTCETTHVNPKKLKIELAWFNNREKIDDDNYLGNGKLKENTFIPQTIKIRHREKEKRGIFSKSFVAYYELIKHDYTEK